MLRFVRIIAVVMIALGLILGVYALVAYLGWQSGQRQRLTLAEQEQSAEITRQVELARTDINQNSPDLALRRLEWVLQQQPDHPEARSLKALAEQLRSQDATPTPFVIPSPTADVTVTPVSAEDAEAAEALRQAEMLASAEDWAAAIPALIAFQQDFPEYERRRSDELLFNALVTHGTELLYTERAELGLSYLRQAATLGDLPQEALDQQQWALLYLSGISFYSVNWEVAIFYFRELCLSAPFFHDACSRLEQALVSYADGYLSIREYCPAEPLLQEAYGLSGSQAVADKLGAARAGCANATPPPVSPITGTLPLTGSLPVTGTLPGPPPIIEGP